MTVQLDFWECEVSLMPWRGQSPRALTRARKALFLRREAQKGDRFVVDPNQYDLFPVAIQRPPQYEGAPSIWE